MNIEVATTRDAPSILELQKLSYVSEAEIYNDYDIDPLTQTLESLHGDFEKQVILKASVNGKIVGSVRGYVDNGTCYIRRLFVHPDFRNQGIGKQLVNKMESLFKTAERYELFTGYRSERNLYLYQKLGYSAFKTEQIHYNLAMMFLEKYPNAG